MMSLRQAPALKGTRSPPLLVVICGLHVPCCDAAPTLGQRRRSSTNAGAGRTWERVALEGMAVAPNPVHLPAVIARQMPLHLDPRGAVYDDEEGGSGSGPPSGTVSRRSGGPDHMT